MTYYLCVGLSLFAIELAYLFIAKRLGVVDIPHYQSSHTGVIIRGGGILFYLAYLLWFFWGGMQYPMSFMGLTIVAITSFIDDIHSISPRVRLLFQFLGILLMLYETDMFTMKIQTMLLLSIVCVGVVNIYNFMDGINGMTGGFSVIVLLPLLYLNTNHIEFVPNDLLIFVLLAVTIFCVFNFRKKALCFAGDVGSLSIGFIVLFLLLKIMFESHHMYWIALVSVYMVDGVMTILHRIMLSENVTTPHKKHVYQIMVNELGMSHLKVSLIYMGLQALLSVWFIIVPGDVTLLTQAGILIGLYLWFIYKFYPLHENKFK